MKENWGYYLISASYIRSECLALFIKAFMNLWAGFFQKRDGPTLRALPVKVVGIECKQPGYFGGNQFQSQRTCDGPGRCNVGFHRRDDCQYRACRLGGKAWQDLLS